MTYPMYVWVLSLRLPRGIQNRNTSWYPCVSHLTVQDDFRLIGSNWGAFSPVNTSSTDWPFRISRLAWNTFNPKGCILLSLPVWMNAREVWSVLFFKMLSSSWAEVPSKSPVSFRCRFSPFLWTVILKFVAILSSSLNPGSALVIMIITTQWGNELSHGKHKLWIQESGSFLPFFPPLLVETYGIWAHREHDDLPWVLIKRLHRVLLDVRKQELLVARCADGSAIVTDYPPTRIFHHPTARWAPNLFLVYCLLWSWFSTVLCCLHCLSRFS